MFQGDRLGPRTTVAGIDIGYKSPAELRGFSLSPTLVGHGYIGQTHVKGRSSWRDRECGHMWRRQWHPDLRLGARCRARSFQPTQHLAAYVTHKCFLLMDAAHRFLSMDSHMGRCHPLRDDRARHCSVSWKWGQQSFLDGIQCSRS